MIIPNSTTGDLFCGYTHKSIVNIRYCSALFVITKHPYNEIL